MYKNTKIRLARDDDKEGVLDLLNRAFSRQQRSGIKRNTEYWNWKFRENFFDESILTVAEHDSQIIGIDHLWPWQFCCRGEIIKAVQACDAAVDSQYRGKGIFKEMRKAGIEKAIKLNYGLIFNFPNQNSLPGNLSIGSCYLGKISWWIKVLKPFQIAKGLFISAKSNPLEINREYRIQTELLDMIAKDSYSLDSFIKINREKGFHQWRYLNNPIREYGMSVYEEKGKCIAAVFTINKRGANREMVVVDLVGSKELSLPLFEKITSIGQKLDVNFLAVMENVRFDIYHLWKRGFLKKKLKNMVTLPLHINLEEKVKDFSCWSLNAGMHDSI